MDFRNASARQPEIVRSVQKDSRYTDELSEEFSDILRLTGSRNWIKYNQMCKLLAEITYHGFVSMYNLQTLGEEYTGIIQVDMHYKQIPSRLIQLAAIILEFGGEAIYLRVLQKLEKHISDHEDIVPKAKEKCITLINLLRFSPTYVKAMHKSIFYLQSNKYQISKRVTGINYVLIRHWLQPEFSLYGYKILGVITFLQVTFSLAISAFENCRDHKRKKYEAATKPNKDTSIVGKTKNGIPGALLPQCVLCLEPRTNASVTPCGHIFCWHCLLEWLDERDECPVCRETLKKSQILQLLNFS